MSVIAHRNSLNDDAPAEYLDSDELEEEYNENDGELLDDSSDHIEYLEEDEDIVLEFIDRESPISNEFAVIANGVSKEPHASSNNFMDDGNFHNIKNLIKPIAGSKLSIEPLNSSKSLKYSKNIDNETYLSDEDTDSSDSDRMHIIKDRKVSNSYKILRTERINLQRLKDWKTLVKNHKSRLTESDASSITRAIAEIDYKRNGVGRKKTSYYNHRSQLFTEILPLFLPNLTNHVFKFPETSDSDVQSYFPDESKPSGLVKNFELVITKKDGDLIVYDKGNGILENITKKNDEIIVKPEKVVCTKCLNVPQCTKESDLKFRCPVCVKDVNSSLHFRNHLKEYHKIGEDKHTSNQIGLVMTTLETYERNQKRKKEEFEAGRDNQTGRDEDRM